MASSSTAVYSKFDGFSDHSAIIPAQPWSDPHYGALVPMQMDASKLTFVRTNSPKDVPAPDSPVRDTGAFCTDHMVTVTWREDRGWDAPQLRPYGPLNIMPNASVLHYATECFEGMKAYRGIDGRLRIFRPDCNAQRMLRSASRIALPAFDTKEFLKLVSALLEIDGPKFLPRDQPRKFIYIRPAMIGTHEGIGVQVPKEALLFIIASYVPDLSKPGYSTRLIASALDEVRAWPGGHGYAKVGANYAPTLKTLQAAQETGYDQVLWLFGPEGKVTEAGGSNFFILWRSREGKLQLQTAPLSDKMILDGVIRRSIIQLAKDRLSANTSGMEQIEVVDESFTMAAVVDAFNDGRIVEAFTCGTAVRYQSPSLRDPC